MPCKLEKSPAACPVTWSPLLQPEGSDYQPPPPPPPAAQLEGTAHHPPPPHSRVDAPPTPSPSQIRCRPFSDPVCFEVCCAYGRLNPVSAAVPVATVVTVVAVAVVVVVVVAVVVVVVVGMRFLPPWRVCYSTAVGWEGGGLLHAEVSNPRAFTVFATPSDCSCVLVFRADPCWNASICMVFACQEANNTVFTAVFAYFQKAFFSGRSNPMVFTVLSTPLHCSCALCLQMFFAQQEPKSMIFTVSWLRLRRQFFQQVI